MAKNSEPIVRDKKPDLRVMRLTGSGNYLYCTSPSCADRNKQRVQSNPDNFRVIQGEDSLTLECTHCTAAYLVLAAVENYS